MGVIGIALTLYVPVCVVEDDVSYAKTQNGFSIQFERGQGIAKDLEKVIHWYRKEATNRLAGSKVLRQPAEVKYASV